MPSRTSKSDPQSDDVESSFHEAAGHAFPPSVRCLRVHRWKTDLGSQPPGHLQDRLVHLGHILREDSRVFGEPSDASHFSSTPIVHLQLRASQQGLITRPSQAVRRRENDSAGFSSRSRFAAYRRTSAACWRIHWASPSRAHGRSRPRRSP